MKKFFNKNANIIMRGAFFPVRINFKIRPDMKMHEEGNQGGHSVKHSTDTQQSKALKTDSPLSEKDEVKKAETRTRKALKDHL